MNKEELVVHLRGPFHRELRPKFRDPPSAVELSGFRSGREFPVMLASHGQIVPRNQAGTTSATHTRARASGATEITTHKWNARRSANIYRSDRIRVYFDKALSAVVLELVGNQPRVTPSNTPRRYHSARGRTAVNGAEVKITRNWTGE